MKKFVTMMLVLTFTLCVLVGCTNQSSWTLTFKDGGNYTVVSEPDIKSGGSFGWQEESDGTQKAVFILKKDGEYYLTLKDEAGKEYKITITRSNGKVDAKTDDGITFELEEK